MAFNKINGEYLELFRNRVVSLKIGIDIRNIWIGLYWNPIRGNHVTFYNFYLCLIPCLVVNMTISVWDEYQYIGYNEFDPYPFDGNDVPF